jgi:hypothetical protein
MIWRSYRTTSRRKFPSQANVRSTFQRRLYLRNFRPSCVLGRLRPFLWGQISSIPRLFRRLRNSVQSYARSAITRLGLFLGRPGPFLGTAIVSSVDSASFTSAGEAESSRFPKGTPWPSTTTIHFVPLPRFVFPTQAPLFLQRQSSRPRRTRSSPVSLLNQVPPEKPATLSTIPLALPIDVIASNRCLRLDILPEGLATSHPFSAPKGCLQTPLDCAAKAFQRCSTSVKVAKYSPTVHR